MTDDADTYRDHAEHGMSPSVTSDPDQPPSKPRVAGSNPAGDATDLSTNRVIPEPPLCDLGSEYSPTSSQSPCVVHPDAERFWAKVSRDDDGCWRWTASTTAPGWHGVISWDGRRQLAHRVSWQLHRGPIAHGMRVLHRCDVAACVNPDHLWLGTQQDNMRDCANKGRLGVQRTRQTHCKRGHELTPENTLPAHGRRRCKTCAYAAAGHPWQGGLYRYSATGRREHIRKPSADRSRGIGHRMSVGAVDEGGG